MLAFQTLEKNRFQSLGEDRKWNITDYSASIRDAVKVLNDNHQLGIAAPYDAPTEYEALKICRKHWQKLRKLGIDLIKEKDYPQIKQVEQIGNDHWRCTNHSKGSVYEITKDGEQFNCTCPANQNGIFCTHIEALLNSPVYTETEQPAAEPASLSELLSSMRKHTVDSDNQVLFPSSKPVEPSGIVAPWDEPAKVDEAVRNDADSKPLSKSSSIDSFSNESIPCPGVVNSNSGLYTQEKSRDIASTINIPTDEPLVLPNGFVASADQRGAFFSVQDWYDGPEQFYVICGSAGSGKTSLLQLLIECLPATRIAIVASSNKAVKVVQSKISQVSGKVVNTMTSAKLLGIRPSRGSETQTFERDPNAECLVSSYDLIIADECSMIGRNSFEWLLSEMNVLFAQTTKCLFMGDDAQLPPVLEDTSLTFTDIPNKSTLTEVIRNDGAVLEWGAFLREHLKDHRIIKPQTSFNEDKTKGVWVLPKDQWETQLIRAFTAAKEKGYDADAVRALAWTNKRVNQLNDKVRRALNPNAAQFEVGDRLITKAPFLLNVFGNEPDSWLQSADELTVVREAISGESQGVPVWLVLVETIDGKKVQVPIVKKSGMGRYNQRLKELTESKQFGGYWDFRESFCEVNHAYALTVHNSQGSTFKDVFIDAKDICKCSDRTSLGTWIRQHLLYVAESRASHRVFITFDA